MSASPGDEPPRTRRQVAEDRLAAQQARRVRRAPTVLLAVLNTLVLLVAITIAVDLRRLDTPGGAALSWAEAVTIGECHRYFLLSVPPQGVADPRDEDATCRALQAQARARAGVGGTQVRLVRAAPGSAVVSVESGGTTREVPLRLVDRGRWRVVRDPSVCPALGCP